MATAIPEWRKTARLRAAERGWPVNPTARAIPVSMARMIGAVRKLEQPAEQPRIQRDPTYWRRKAKEMRQRNCTTCKGTGVIHVAISEFEQEREPCPNCQNEFPALDTMASVPLDDIPF